MDSEKGYALTSKNCRKSERWVERPRQVCSLGQRLCQKNGFLLWAYWMVCVCFICLEGFGCGMEGNCNYVVSHPSCLGFAVAFVSIDVFDIMTLHVQL